MLLVEKRQRISPVWLNESLKFELHVFKLPLVASKSVKKTFLTIDR